MKCAIVITSCFAACLLLGQTTLPLQIEDNWQVFLNVQAPKEYNKIPRVMTTPDGRNVTPRTAKMRTDNGINLKSPNGSFKPESQAILYNEFQSPSSGTMQAGASADWWMEIYVNGKKVLSTIEKGNGTFGTFKPNDHVFSFPVIQGKNIIAARVKSGSAGWRFVYGKPEDPKPNVRFEANGEWKPVDMNDLYIKEGSALDQRAIAAISQPSGNGSVKKLPRLGVGPTGKIALAEQSDISVKLRGTGANTPWIVGRTARDPNWKETWKREAVNLRMLGYNLIRLSTDALCYKDEYLAPNLLDKFDYFIGVFAEQGAYTFLTIGASGVYLKNAWGPLKPGERRDYKLRMYLGDEQVRKAWKYGVATLMNHVNAYTGTAWKDDPNIACIELFNEQEWGFFHPKSSLSPVTQREFDARFQAWLKAKYQTAERLSKAWGSPSLRSFDKVRTPDNFPFSGIRLEDNDYILFCAELSHESAAWMRNTLRAAGYKGMVAQYNLSPWLAGQETRWEESPVNIANTYHNHPSMSSSPGSRCGQNSSVGSGAWYWRSIAAMRFADRPFIVTEFNHSFWNPYQYECGPLFSAYSALQGIDGLMIHEGAVFTYADKNPGQGIFSVSKSPASRAGEFLAGCLYLRGDVKASPHRVELEIPKEYLESNCNGARSISSEQRHIAFLTGFTIAFPWAKRPAGVINPSAPDLTMPPDNGAEFKSAGGGWAISGQDSTSSTFSLDAAVVAMKTKGILPKDNISAPSKGIFQSDTGEITIRVKEKLLKVATPRSEAVTLEGGKGEKVGSLNVVNTSIPAMVAACAIDDGTLANSKRIVLIYSTESVNTDLELSADRVTLVNLGRPPILMRSGKLDIAIKNTNAANMSLYALGFNGLRRERLAVAVKGEFINISIDTGRLKDGPTPFFELIAE